MTAPAYQVAQRGMERGRAPDPCVIVIFGATGDLTRRELIPALYELARQDLLPQRYAVVGFSRGKWDDAGFRGAMEQAVRQGGGFEARSWEAFASHLAFVPGDFTAAPTAGYAALKSRLSALAGANAMPANALFHLAAPPEFFAPIVERLAASGLAQDEHAWRRVVIEKPFGTDRESAAQLDRSVRAVFREEQIFRIDHFLGKETVQNMLVFRFANASFEPVWNRNYIEQVQITVAEDIGIGTRGGFYEETGVVRDMLQNHLLQLLCLTAIEPPVRFSGDAVRDETAKVLQAVCQVDPSRDCVRGQYGPGTVRGEAVAGYRQEDRVARDSGTPTYVAARLFLDNWRWAGVPFYLRTGKRMPRQLTEVTIHFKPTPHLMFPGAKGDLHRNTLAFRLQPDEGIIQTFAAKQPGPDLTIRPVRSTFLYADAFGLEMLPRAYAWLLRDVMEGDQTLFARSDWIYRAWGIVDPIIRQWEATPPGDFPNYAAGTWGPGAAARLIQADGHAWSTV